MRFIHTADWHLGRILHQVHLTQDQAHVLDQLEALARESRADALLIAGDVYDRAVPPPDAVGLLDDFLSRMVLGLKVPVVLIAGNHDSPERLGFGARLHAAGGLHLAGRLSADPPAVEFHDRFGPVLVHALPYAEPAFVRERLDRDTICDHDSAMSALLDRVRESRPSGARSILVTHAFVAGGEECESERHLTVGGTGTVGPGRFEGFHYVALGHLHRAQAMSGNRLQYSGSLLKYSFSEANQPKSVHVVEMDARGDCAVERVALTPRRDVRCIRGTMKELLAGPASGESREDYITAVLTDPEPVLDAMGKLSAVYPNLLHIDRTYLASGGENCRPGADHRRLGDAELFSAFFSQVTGEELTGEEKKSFAGIVDTLRQREREADR
ncbi:MAG: exonuclease SbcCD subunit D [Syntrophobacteraceae bacterium]|nr:exonuclease SbcCD subunit D [Desulfobacteraceae bacterium]